MSGGRMAQKAKRVLDVTGAAVGLTLTAPVLAAAALGVRVTMGSPVLFAQERAGLHGKPFRLLKLRTMREPKLGEERFASDADRITGLGRFLRQSSLDELPALVNVLRGEMSLVGPRPLLLEYLERYSPRQARRHEVKPGVTGLVAVRGRNALSWPEKLELDVVYVETWSLALDCQILLETVLSVLSRRGVSHGEHATMPIFQGEPATEGAH